MPLKKFVLGLLFQAFFGYHALPTSSSMNCFLKVFSLVTTFSLGLAGSLFAAVEPVEVASVPEPSVALLGGLCGILFLLWRKK